MSKRRLLEIEALLDRLDPDSEEYQRLDAEANEIADGINAVEESYAKREKEKELALEKKISELVRLNESGQIDTMIAQHGDEFMGDYAIHDDGLTVTSAASDMEWSHLNEVELKEHMRKLVYDRIYNKYLRPLAVRSYFS